ncbi:hypothetical protein [Amycolatopsis sp. lyj-90]|uniref:hypothetical protein n=1 Tax=Amycolatopsis sp. lyj-90 TaxID=2789285 RepID=UPI00397D4CD1
MNNEAKLFEDPFGSTSSQLIGWTRSLSIGSINISSAVIESNFSSAINDRPKASIRLRAAHPTIPYVDWRAPVSASIIENGQPQPLFIGNIIKVDRDGDEILLECSTAAYFSDVLLGLYTATRNAGTDLIYATARDGGTPGDMINIDMTGVPYETFEVVIPISGISKLAEPFRQGNVLFTSEREFLREANKFNHAPLMEKIEKSEVFAVAYQAELRMYDAEKSALTQVLTALAWLTTRSHYSLAVLPDECTPAWSRSTASARISCAPLAYVRGLLSGRSWLRETATRKHENPLDLDDSKLMLRHPGNLGTPSQRARQALYAYTRAVHEVDAPSRVTLIWEAIEFYAGKTDIPEKFSKAELKKIRRSVPKDLSKSQISRINDLVGMLNSAPLLARLRAQIASDGIPMTEEEFQILANLRALRNDLVHGRVTGVGPAGDEIEHGLALVARMITYWVARAH